MLKTLTLAYSLAIILSYISRVTAFLFSPGVTDVYFVDMMACKNTKCNMQKNAGNTVPCRVSAVYPHTRTADWELFHCRCPASQERITYSISLAQENIKPQNSKYGFS